MESCGSCKFSNLVDENRDQYECRRNAPTHHRWLAYHDSDLLRDIAWSLRALANIEMPGEKHELSIEATEADGLSCFPCVSSEEWCGEYAPKAGS